MFSMPPPPQEQQKNTDLNGQSSYRQVLVLLTRVSTVPRVSSPVKLQKVGESVLIWGL